MHVAALPFPSPQGTQGALRAMLDACASRLGSDAHLLAYASGAGALGDARFTLHRSAAPLAASLRSGPSLGKVAADVALGLELRRLVRALRPDVVVAHHVEAGVAALLVVGRPLVFVAHTELAPELPTYAPRLVAPFVTPLLGRAGGVLDAALCRRADAVAAVGPALAERLAASTGAVVHTLALPWPLPSPITADERSIARAALGIAPDDEVALYAGNLDRYQGLPVALEALGRAAVRRTQLRVLIATESARRGVSSHVRRAGLERRVAYAPLHDESARRLAHAAADVALVPRAIDGGVPVKLLDALARGVPVVAQRRALGGLALSGAAMVCADDDADALAAAIVAMLAAPRAAGEVADRGRAYIGREHSDVRFLATLEVAIAHALDARGRRGT